MALYFTRGHNHTNSVRRRTKKCLKLKRTYTERYVTLIDQWPIRGGWKRKLKIKFDTIVFKKKNLC